MANESSIINRRFNASMLNGNDFSINPVSSSFTYMQDNVGGLVKETAEVIFAINSRATTANIWAIVGAIGNNVITRTSGSFFEDGLEENDQVHYFTDLEAGTTDAVSRNIIGISEKILILDGTAIAPDVTNPGIVEGVRNVGVLEDFTLTFNLPNSTEGNATESKIDGLIQSYDIIGVGLGGPRSILFVDGTYESSLPTSQDAKGSFKIRFVTDVSTYIQKFEYEHIFRVKPWFLDGDNTNIRNEVPPVDLEGDLSYNYLIALNAYTNFKDPNSNKSINENLEGNTGWFNEVFNGGKREYFLDAITYTDKVTTFAVDSIQVDKVTQVQITLNAPNIDIDSNLRYSIGISKLPTEEEATNNLNTFTENFVFAEITTLRNALVINEDFIKLLLVIPDVGDPSNKVIANFEVDFTAAQQLLLSSDSEYVIWMGAKHPGVDKWESVWCDVQFYQKDNDVPDQLFVEGQDFIYHPDDELPTIGDQFSDVKGWIESGFLYRNDFAIKHLSSCTSMNVRLVAFNVSTGDVFEIESQKFDIDKTKYDGVSGAQIDLIEIDETRSFLLPADDKFNRVRVTKGLTDTGEQHYILEYAYKTQWMDYIELLTANNIVFFDAAQPLNGLNRKLSNYSAVSGYAINVFLDFVIRDESLINVNPDAIDTQYRVISPDIDVFDYDESGVIVLWTGSIKVFMPDGTTEITGNISNVDKVILEATFVPDSDQTGVAFWGEFNLQKDQVGIPTSIHRRSSLFDELASDPLIPLIGESFTKVTNNGTSIVVEARIDPALLTEVSPGECVNISCEIGDQVGSAAIAKRTESGLFKETEDGLQKILE